MHKKFEITFDKDFQQIADFDNPSEYTKFFFQPREIFEILRKEEENPAMLLPYTHIFTRLYENSNGEFVHKKDSKITVPPQEVIAELTTRYSFDPRQYHIERAANNIEVIIIFPEVLDLKDDVIRCMEQLNWILYLENVTAMPTKQRTHHYIQLRFEPKYPFSANEFVHKTGVLYHITSENNLAEIKKSGLLPQSKNFLFKYPPRVYFVKGNVNKSLLHNVANMLYDERPEYNDESVICVEVNPDKLNGVDFYFDPLFQHGIYTYDKIPINAVVKVYPVKKQMVYWTNFIKSKIKKIFGWK